MHKATRASGEATSLFKHRFYDLQFGLQDVEKLGSLLVTNPFSVWNRWTNTINSQKFFH